MTLCVRKAAAIICLLIPNVATRIAMFDTPYEPALCTAAINDENISLMTWINCDAAPYWVCGVRDSAEDRRCE
jgi:hypothetical protein